MPRRNWLPDNVTEYRDRHGKLRYRFRKSGLPVYHFKSQPGTEAFREEYRAACSASKPPIAVQRAAPGTIADLIVKFYQSPAWKGNMKPSSQATYRNILERFRTKHGDKTVANIKAVHLDAILGAMSATPAAANNLRKILKRVFAYAVKLEMRDDNPVMLTDAYRMRSGGFHTWTEGEIAQFEARWPLGTKPRLAMALMLYTGQRRSDAILMGRQHVAKGRIRLWQQKTGDGDAHEEGRSIPLHPQLRAAIDAMPRSDHLTFLVTEFGKPFTAPGFGNWFRERCNDADLPQCSAHGLRKAMSRRLAERGATNLQGRAVTGHRTDRVFMHYAEKADQAALADAAMANLGTRFAKSPKKKR